MSGQPTPPRRRLAAGDQRRPAITAADRLSGPARRALAHIRARTITGRFACPLYDLPSRVREDALDELRKVGYRIVWTRGQVADDPTVTGGYVLDADQPAGSAR
jgi:hypothetical protein